MLCRAPEVQVNALDDAAHKDQKLLIGISPYVLLA